MKVGIKSSTFFLTTPFLCPPLKKRMKIKYIYSPKRTSKGGGVIDSSSFILKGLPSVQGLKPVNAMGRGHKSETSGLKTSKWARAKPQGNSVLNNLETVCFSKYKIFEIQLNLFQLHVYPTYPRGTGSRPLY